MTRIMDPDDQVRPAHAHPDRSSSALSRKVDQLSVSFVIIQGQLAELASLRAELDVLKRTQKRTTRRTYSLAGAVALVLGLIAIADQLPTQSVLQSAHAAVLDNVWLGRSGRP